MTPRDDGKIDRQKFWFAGGRPPKRVPPKSERGLAGEIAFADAAKMRHLEEEIIELEKRLDDQTRALAGAKSKAGIKEFQKIVSKLNETQWLIHLGYRVGDAARTLLLESEEFRARFDTSKPCESFVVSIDIRRSTELMLKARDPRLYAEFVTSLCSELRDIALRNFGVFDKFTGDGVMAFFPKFFSGEDAGYLAVKTAHECHAAFARHYKAHRKCFTAVLNDTGLGIGIDYGNVQLVQVAGELAVVGTPVVYACRMGGGRAGWTLANQPAYEVLKDRYGEHCTFSETEIDVKHEGPTLAYRVARNDKPRAAAPPPWLTSAKEK